MTFVLLAVAIAFEVLATSAPEADRRLHPPMRPSLITIIGYGLAFSFLALTLRTLPVGIVYAIWAGVGVVVVALIGWLVFRQPLDLGHSRHRPHHRRRAGPQPPLPLHGALETGFLPWLGNDSGPRALQATSSGRGVFVCGDADRADDVADQVARCDPTFMRSTSRSAIWLRRRSAPPSEAAARGAGRLYSQIDPLLGSLRSSGADLADTAGRRSASAYRGADDRRAHAGGPRHARPSRRAQPRPPHRLLVALRKWPGSRRGRAGASRAAPRPCARRRRL